ncbi:MAG: hypothetical protein RL757_819 [Bacteroidota bacterium]|jgi:hypothetical protein
MNKKNICFMDFHKTDVFFVLKTASKFLACLTFVIIFIEK